MIGRAGQPALLICIKILEKKIFDFWKDAGIINNRSDNILDNSLFFVFRATSVGSDMSVK